MHLAELSLESEGAQLFSAALSLAQLNDLTCALSTLLQDQAGVRLTGIPELYPFLLSVGPVGRIPAAVLGSECRPVRAILFDKRPGQNWSLAWHQDRTVVVKRRIQVEGFGPWSIKRGMVHVEPPPSLLAKMLTVRVHLDAVPSSNAPLLIAPASHKRGRVPTPNIPGVVNERGVIACLAEAGDIWLYSTSILHASDAATKPGHRRVLQVDYSAEQLPNGLEWLGV